MTSRKPFLPIGMQDFDEIRTMKALYVDKTRYIPELRKSGKFIFCARPRRFGKSLMCSTLDSFYSGRKKLFKGLAAEKAINAKNFVARPVISLDMSLPAGSESIERFEEKLNNLLIINAERHDIAVKGGDYANAFFNLMKDIYKKYSNTQAVLIIDEYDAPIVRLDIQSEDPRDRDLLKMTRITMDNFYSQIKPASKYLHFAFITGITKFSGMGVFSTLNNLKDISLLRKYGSFMGYTQPELETYFTFFIERIAKKLKMEKAVFIEKIKEYYDGFSFDGVTRLYNPQSILNFFGDKDEVDPNPEDFGNYWMESGSNTIVREIIKKENFSLDFGPEQTITLNAIRAPGPIEKVSADLFLYQAGYLTLRKNKNKSYFLDYPNLETRSSMSLLLIELLLNNEKLALTLTENVKPFLMAGDVPALIATLRRMYASISYQDFTDSYRANIGEFFFRSVLQSFLIGACVNVTSEAVTNKGRIDLLARYGGHNYVIEMKTAEGEAGTRKAIEIGRDQIENGNYAGSSIDPIILLIVIDKNERNIGACVFWRKGVASEVKIQKTRLPLPE